MAHRPSSTVYRPSTTAIRREGAVLRDHLSLYLASLGAPVCEEYVTWGRQVLRVQSYVGDAQPPVEYVTSVRCVVLHGDQVLVVRDPDELHILPGGRREREEHFEQTAIREVAEETGWLVGALRLVGVKHFYHLSPKPARHPYPFPVFLQLVYTGSPLRYDAAVREANGWELSAEFVAVTSATISTLRMSDRHFLSAARRLLTTPAPVTRQVPDATRRSFAL
jgi:8-oxo-dGTP pyrophosphatase MutT (NUDIX family)